MERVQQDLAALLARTDAAIVDLDGTMVDTLGDFAEALVSLNQTSAVESERR